MNFANKKLKNKYQKNKSTYLNQLIRGNSRCLTGKTKALSALKPNHLARRLFSGLNG